MSLKWNPIKRLLERFHSVLHTNSYMLHLHSYLWDENYLSMSWVKTMTFSQLPCSRVLLRGGSVMWDINIWHIAWTVQWRFQPIRGWDKSLGPIRWLDKGDFHLVFMSYLLILVNYNLCYREMSYQGSHNIHRPWRKCLSKYDPCSFSFVYTQEILFMVHLWYRDFIKVIMIPNGFHKIFLMLIYPVILES